jgi:hypothetical protein
MNASLESARRSGREEFFRIVTKSIQLALEFFSEAGTNSCDGVVVSHKLTSPKAWTRSIAGGDY